VILVVNHMHLDSGLERLTEPFLSAAEALVIVSGVVSGMVFGRRWLTHGARATTRALLHRSFVLYRASVILVALVGLLTVVPGLATDALTIAPRATGPDLYAFGDPLSTLLAVVALEAGPWQFNVLGFFIAALAATPLVLWALARGWWPVVVAASWALYLVGRATSLEVLPSQSEGPFPFLVWQLLFVHGVVAGWYREPVTRAVRRARPLVVGLVVAAAGVAALARLHEIGVNPLGLGGAWDAEHFAKPPLDPARLASMVAFTAAAYLVLRRFEAVAARTVGRVLIPLGRSSFYVFIVHVFVCLAVASVPVTSGPGLGLAGNAAIQLGCVLALWWMVHRRVLFRWIPR
jgi:hypothetical protein